MTLTNTLSFLLCSLCAEICSCPITIAIDCNGLSLLIFEEKWPNPHQTVIRFG